MNRVASKTARACNALGLQWVLRTAITCGALMGLPVACGTDGIACTRVGCVSALSVTIHAEDWSPGEYTVVLTPQDERQAATHCEVSVPPPPGIESLEACAHASQEGRSPSLRLGAGLTLQVPALDGQPSGLGVPANLLVTRDGETLLDTDIDPDLETTFPNGPDCGACYGARAVVSIDR